NHPPADVEPFEQVVRQEGVLGDWVRQRRIERVDVEQAFTGENAFAEKVLVGVGNRGRVRVDSRMSGIQPSEERPGCARERDADPWLEGAGSLCDAPQLGVEGRSIEWMRDDADQLPGDVARQARVAVERDAVAHMLQYGD